ncbi:Fibulin-1 [Anabarilius grahami]|uniref:Fibulin-1 n=1 Tax=Anabarilius grahami TaxID=495550 RepID=A0A3N0XLK8_ANAGA|nr:Fibulin-1 [Anabarilius grahami]
MYSSGRSQKTLTYNSGQRPRVDRADFIRCVKSCQPNDISCVLSPILSTSHTAISLPTFREFSKPEELVFLRSPTPSHLPNMDSLDIVYDILEGNVQNSFDIVKRLDRGMIVGLQSRRHHLRPPLLRLKTLVHVLFILSPCFSFAISMWPCFPLLWHDRL